MSNDQEIMAYIDSCNIACGGHAGDKSTMIQSLKLSKKYGVLAGAHPSFEDRDNFGRKEMFLPNKVLKDQLIKQIDVLNQLAKNEGMKLHHVKAHGALYNMAARSDEIATVFIEAVQYFKQDLCVYVPFESELEKKAKEKRVPFRIEVFADRNYDDDFTLISRSDAEAVIEGVEEIKSRVERMLRDGNLISLHGRKRNINFDTLCVHSDHPKAVEIVRALRALKKQYN